MVKAPKPRLQKPSGLLKSLTETKKQDTRVLGKIERLLLAEQQQPSGRRFDCLHPSAICKADWCPRANYFELLAPEVRETHGFALMNIFDEGHAIHDKWQDRFRRAGVLEGRYRCLHCDHKWWDTSPAECPNIFGPIDGSEIVCKSKAIKYDEVTVDGLEQYHIWGHADGIITDEQGRAVLEVKSIGEGTVRFEEPSLLKQHVREDGTVDLSALWNGIKRPFPSHIRQATIYGHVLGLEWIIFLYECKWNQAVKEFVVKVDPKNIERILDGALDIKYALKTNRPPACIGDACKICPKENGDTSDRSSASESLAVDAGGSGGSGGSPAEEGTVPPVEATVGDSQSTERGTRRPVRRRSDGLVRPVDSLGGLLSGSGSPSGD